MKHNYTDKFRSVLELCFRTAIANSIEEVDADLLVWGIIKEGTNVGLNYLLSKGLDRDSLLKEFEEKLNIRNTEDDVFVEPMKLMIPRMSDSLSMDIDRSLRISIQTKDMAINPLHLIYGILLSENDNLLKHIFKRERISMEDLDSINTDLTKNSLSNFIGENIGIIQNFINNLDPDKLPFNPIKSNMSKDDNKNTSKDNKQDKKNGFFDDAIPIKNIGELHIISPLMEKNEFNINSFGTYLTESARNGMFDPVIGRDEEIDRMIEILCRRKKNNPILIGDAGVGKTSIVEGLAQRIVDGKVPDILIDKKIFSIDVGNLIAGTKFRGEFEERLKTLLDNIEKDRDTIIFIDEIHMIVGSGSVQGSSDMSNMLKPMLNSGNVQCIGTTTTDEYRRSIEKDKALDRRFQKISISPMNKENTLEIIKRVKPKYEEHHRVEYTDAAVNSIIDLCDRYITDRFFPDKAIDVLDEVGASISKKDNVYAKIDRLRKDIERISKDKKVAFDNGDFEASSELWLEEDKAKQELTELECSVKQAYPQVTSSDVEKVVARITRVPLENLSLAENERLRTMKEKLSKVIIGQDVAVDKVCRIVQRGRLGLRSMTKPIGSFLFLGSTGVGKTEMAKQLSEYLFGSQDNMIRIDMSEYMEKFAVSRLIGAPPGYVGYEEGGFLTEKVRRNPYSVVLFDEMEKAHPDVYNILLQIMDDGVVTDNEGNKIDFRHTVIIMTSNVGSRKAKEFSNAIGFTDSDDNSKHIHSIFNKELRKSFSPEFLNRIDEIIEFNNLSKDDIRKIVDIEIEKMVSIYNNAGYRLKVSDKVRDIIASNSYDHEYGARPLKRKLQKEIDDRVTEIILSMDIAKQSLIKVKTNRKSEIVVEVI